MGASGSFYPIGDSGSLVLVVRSAGNIWSCITGVERGVIGRAPVMQSFAVIIARYGVWLRVHDSMAGIHRNRVRSAAWIALEAHDWITLTAHDRPLCETCGCLRVLRILGQGIHKIAASG